MSNPDKAAEVAGTIVGIVVAVAIFSTLTVINAYLLTIIVPWLFSTQITFWQGLVITFSLKLLLE
jgi:ABC-type transport system substrate-binding protein